MEYENILKNQFNELIDKDALADLSNRASELTNGLSDNFDIDKLIEATLNGETIFNNQDIITSLKDLFIFELRGAIILGIEILTICIVIGLLKNISTSFNSKSTADLGMIICNVIIIGICLNNFKNIFILTLDTVDVMCKTMEILFPILLVTLISMGMITTGSVLNPILATSITFFL